jgi:hypothetical protein
LSSGNVAIAVAKMLVSPCLKSTFAAALVAIAARASAGFDAVSGTATTEAVTVATVPVAAIIASVVVASAAVRVAADSTFAAFACGECATCRLRG